MWSIGTRAINCKKHGTGILGDAMSFTTGNRHDFSHVEAAHVTMTFTNMSCVSLFPDTLPIIVMSHPKTQYVSFRQASPTPPPLHFECGLKQKGKYYQYITHDTMIQMDYMNLPF